MTINSPQTGRRRLYLMRHGHVDYFAPGLTDFTQVPLTDLGQDQARSAGQALRQIQFDKVFHSGLPRTVETAALVQEENENNSVPAIALPGMAELRGGEYVAPTNELLAARLAYSFDVANEEGATFLPGGELFQDAYARIVLASDQLVLGHCWQTALMVAHEGVNRLFISHFLGAGLMAAKSLEQDLACINIIDFDVVPAPQSGLKIERAILKMINATPYDGIKYHLNRTSLEHLFDIDFKGQRPTDFTD